MNYKILAERVKFFKEDVKGVETMSKFVEELKEENSKEIAKKLLQETDLSYEKISDIVNLPIEKVKSLDDTNHFKGE